MQARLPFASVCGGAALTCLGGGRRAAHKVQGALLVVLNEELCYLVALALDREDVASRPAVGVAAGGWGWEGDGDAGLEGEREGAKEERTRIDTPLCTILPIPPALFFSFSLGLFLCTQRLWHVRESGTALLWLLSAINGRLPKAAGNASGMRCEVAEEREREREERGEERTHYLDRGESRGGAVRALRNTERCRRATEDERGKETRGRWLSPLLAFLSRFSPPLLLTLCFLHSVCSGHVNTVPCQR